MKNRFKTLGILLAVTTISACNSINQKLDEEGTAEVFTEIQKNVENNPPKVFTYITETTYEQSHSVDDCLYQNSIKKQKLHNKASYIFDSTKSCVYKTGEQSETVEFYGGQEKTERISDSESWLFFKDGKTYDVQDRTIKHPLLSYTDTLRGYKVYEEETQADVDAYFLDKALGWAYVGPNTDPEHFIQTRLDILCDGYSWGSPKSYETSKQEIACYTDGTINKVRFTAKDNRTYEKKNLSEDLEYTCKEMEKASCSSTINCTILDSYYVHEVFNFELSIKTKDGGSYHHTKATVKLTIKEGGKITMPDLNNYEKFDSGTK